VVVIGKEGFAGMVVIVVGFELVVVGWGGCIWIPAYMDDGWVVDIYSVDNISFGVHACFSELDTLFISNWEFICRSTNATSSVWCNPMFNSLIRNKMDIII